MRSFSTLLLVVLAITKTSIQQTTRTLHIPSSVPSDASSAIDPSYPGFAFEESSFYNYSFNAAGNPNTFSENLIKSVLNRTGGVPILRVGGTSGDLGHYNASQTSPVNLPATKYGPAFDPPYLSVGPSFFRAFKNFPGARYIFMVPLAHRNLPNTMQWCRQGLEVIGARLEALEIGNEPDLYPWFSVSAYTKEFVRFQKSLSKHFPNRLANRPIFQALDTASSGTSNLSVADALKAGINSTGRISQVGYHLYPVTDVPHAGLDWLQRELVNHTAVVQAMSVFVPDINYLAKHAPGVPFILSEVGNSLGNNDITQRNNLATALWNVDYQLYGMVIGVNRVNNQQIVFPGFGMWEPVASGFSPALVRANYYSQPLIAELIGTSGNTRVADIDVDGSDFMSAYVAYEEGKVSRIAILNLELWTPANGTRPSTEIRLEGIPHSVKKAKAYRLQAPGGAYANDTLTYRGLQWTYESNGLEVRVGADGESLHVTNSEIKLLVEATSAVLIELQP